MTAPTPAPRSPSSAAYADLDGTPWSRLAGGDGWVVDDRHLGAETPAPAVVMFYVDDTGRPIVDISVAWDRDHWAYPLPLDRYASALRLAVSSAAAELMDPWTNVGPEIVWFSYRLRPTSRDLGGAFAEAERAHDALVSVTMGTLRRGLPHPVSVPPPEAPSPVSDAAMEAALREVAAGARGTGDWTYRGDASGAVLTRETWRQWAVVLEAFAMTAGVAYTEAYDRWSLALAVRFGDVGDVMLLGSALLGGQRHVFHVVTVDGATDADRAIVAARELTATLLSDTEIPA
jgi:hypothetical protein